MKKPKIVIITGASAGIGNAVARQFAAAKYNVTLVARSGKELEKLAVELESAYGTQTLICAGDLQDRIFLRSVIDRTVERWGAIDVLVNNAAWRTLETMRTIKLEVWEQTLRICLTAPAFLGKWSAEVMEKNATPGVIINVSSVMSERAGGVSPAYIAAKGAIESLTYELAVTYGRSGIRVLCVRPGNIETAMSSDYADPQGNNVSLELTDHVTDLTPLARAGTPVEVANAIFWFSSEQASFISGSSVLIDGGFAHNFNAYSNKKRQFPDEF